MVKPILQIGDPLLYQQCKPIKDFESVETKNLLRDLLDTCEQNRELTAGLAAPQIGVLKSVCVCRRVDLEGRYENKQEQMPKEKLWEVMINPEVTFRSERISIFWEACLSVGQGETALWGPVSRPAEIKVKYFTATGKVKELSAKGFFSHEIQHEIDHLHGVLFLKYIVNPANIWQSAKLNQYLKAEHAYPEIC